MSNSQVIDQAQGIARSMSYHEPMQASAKHMLHELSHRLGGREVTIRRVKGRLSTVSLFGSVQRMTWREVLVWRLFQRPPIGTFCNSNDPRVAMTGAVFVSPSKRTTP